MSRLISLSVVLLLAAIGCHGFSSGPPISQKASLCEDMTPSHSDNEPSTAPVPFFLRLGGTTGSCYKNGSQIQVQLVLNPDVSPHFPYFEGLFLQARSVVTGDSNNYGMFSIPGGDPDLQLLDCFDNPASAVGHTTKEHWACKRFTWTAPADLTDDVVFHATAVKNFTNFWVGIESSQLTYDADCVGEFDTDFDDMCSGQDNECADAKCCLDAQCDDHEDPDDKPTTTPRPNDGATSITHTTLGMVAALLMALAAHY